MTKALVLGASGFIGTRLVRQLATQGQRVTAIDIAAPRVVFPDVEYLELDVRRRLPEPVGSGASTIHNLAAVHRTPGHLSHEYYETNVLGAIHATTLAELCGIETIVFTSSISVYGPAEELLTERSELKPTSAYGYSKILAEEVHDAWQGRSPGRRLVTVRPGVVFGPGERGNYSHLAKALRGGYFFYPGRKDTLKSGGYVDELLSTFDFALAHSEPKILYNFAYPDMAATEDIVRTLARVAGIRRRPFCMPLPLLLAAAQCFEVANALGLKNPIHRDRVRKLAISTRVAPKWLQDKGYSFNSNLECALQAWSEETDGEFI